jgi:hypothetical protein
LNFQIHLKLSSDTRKTHSNTSCTPSGKWETVYNWEVEDYHTYFVSASEDGANIWAHNVGQGCGQGFTPDQDALIQMAKVLKRTGVLAGDVGTLQQWANEVGLQGERINNPLKNKDLRKTASKKTINLDAIR